MYQRAAFGRVRCRTRRVAAYACLPLFSGYLAFMAGGLRGIKALRQRVVMNAQQMTRDQYKTVGASSNRLLHAMLRVRDIDDSIGFYKACGMQVLSCSRRANGAATAFVGYGSMYDMEHFGLELAQASPSGDVSNQQINIGTGFQSVSISVPGALREFGRLRKDPDGYCVEFVDSQEPVGDPLHQLCFGVQDLDASVQFYSGILGMTQVEQRSENKEEGSILRYTQNRCKNGEATSIRLVASGHSITTGAGYDHLVISTPDVLQAACALDSAGVPLTLKPTVMFGLNITGIQDPD